MLIMRSLFFSASRVAAVLLPMLLCAAVGRASDGIPTVFISVPAGKAIASRDVWTDSVAIRIAMPDSSVVYSTVSAQAKLRGHSSFSKPKKPYAVRLPEAASLLGMPKGRRWVLLANFMDHSSLRNQLALAIARATSLAWTPQSRMVDVVVDGQYQGLYTLAEQVRVGQKRVAADSVNGWFIEGSSYRDGEFTFSSSLRHLPFELKWPKHHSQERMLMAQNDINDVEELLYHRAATKKNYRRLKKKINLTSMADWFIVHELAMNAEPNGPRSCYFYKPVDGRITAGPVWDFDLAFIPVDVDSGGDLRPTRRNFPNSRRLSVDGLYNAEALWFPRLLAYPEFRSLIGQRWQQLRPQFVALADSLDAWITMVRPSALRNDELWQGKDPARFDIHAAFPESSANLRLIYLQRIEALDELLNKEQ